MAMAASYPLSSKEALKKQFVGKSIRDISVPAAVLDLSKLQNNCNRMLSACDALDLGWRAHIKTHKTTELTRLQVGDSPDPVNIIVSTILEAEQVLPLLLEYRSTGRPTSVLYAFPVTPGAVFRLSLIAKALRPNGLSLLIDHPSQLDAVTAIHRMSGIGPGIFLKVDVGAKRAGVPPLSDSTSDLIALILDLQSAGAANFLGLYAHAGQSYYGVTPATALNFLNQEFSALLTVSKTIHSLSPFESLVLSVGATPTTTSIRNLLAPSISQSEEELTAVTALRTTLAAIRATNCTIEIHAGVYPTLDIQQLSTHALPTSGPHAMLSWSDLALTIVVEIASIYPGRGENGTDEYLIGAGTLALGREPCKVYPGWGILTPWNRDGVAMPEEGGAEKFEGWMVGRISQEHGIVSWNGKEGEEKDVFEVGQKVRIWPNHACIAGAGFGWYLIVDSSVEGKEDEIIDVWVRWRGW